MLDEEVGVLSVEERLEMELGRKVELVMLDEEVWLRVEDDVSVGLERLLLAVEDVTVSVELIEEDVSVPLLDDAVSVLLSEELDSVLLCEIVPLLGGEGVSVGLGEEEPDDVDGSVLLVEDGVAVLPVDCEDMVVLLEAEELSEEPEDDGDELVLGDGGGGGPGRSVVLDEEDVPDEELEPVLIDEEDISVLLESEELPDDELDSVVLDDEVVPVLPGEELMLVLLVEDTDSVPLAKDDVLDGADDVPLELALELLLDDVVDKRLDVNVLLSETSVLELLEAEAVIELLSEESVVELLIEGPVLELLAESVLELPDDDGVLILLEGVSVVTVLLSEELESVLLTTEPVLELLTDELVLVPDIEELKSVLLEESDEAVSVLLAELVGPALGLEELVDPVPEELELIDSLAEELLDPALLDIKPLLELPPGDEGAEGAGGTGNAGHDVPVVIVFVKVAVKKEVLV